VKAAASPPERRRAAAERREKHAKTHDELAAMWAEQGDPELAELERRYAELERATARVDRERARLMEVRGGEDPPAAA